MTTISRKNRKSGMNAAESGRGDGFAPAEIH